MHRPCFLDSRSRPRAAFTMIELLVVLGILIILATISVTAFAGSGTVNRLVGTEQLLTSALRQARYTARASGQAVILYVDAADRSVSGVSRLPIWQGACEELRPPFAAGELDPVKFRSGAGRSGSGFFRKPLADGGPADNEAGAIVLFDPTSSDSLLRDRRRQLSRSTTKQTEGFQLTCSVYAPSLSQPGPEWLPLVAIDGDTGAMIPDLDQAYVGLLLRRRMMPMFVGSEVDPKKNPTPPAGYTPTLPSRDRPCYDLIGWVRTDAGIHTVASIMDAVDPGTTSATGQNDLGQAKAARRIGYAGDAWEEVALVSTGAALELMRNGQLVARLELAAPVIVGAGATHRITLGSGTVGSALAASLGLPAPPSYGTDADKHINGKTRLDDVSLMRLGVDQQRQLPNGVVPLQTYRMVVRPDGRLQDQSPTALTDPTGLPALTSGGRRWIFSGVFAEAQDYATVDIDSTTGAISLSQLTLSRNAP